MGFGFKSSLLFWTWLGRIADTYDVQLEDRWRSQEVLSEGMCRYGNRVECCWGWRPKDWRHCQPHCQQECKQGECVSPDRCQCHPGYTGKTCNQDLNECGLRPRPCKHRCVNTHGSFKCYCPNGYTEDLDGRCTSARTCALANCQYGCEVTKGMLRCICPSPGLRLGPDRRSCVDIDECVSGSGGVCPRRRKCVNTFGSYLCKCHQGFKLHYLNGRYTCIDKDPRPFCTLTPDSPKCQCRDGQCDAVIKVTLEPAVHWTTTPAPKTTTTPIIKPTTKSYTNTVQDTARKATTRRPTTTKTITTITSSPTTTSTVETTVFATTLSPTTTEISTSSPSKPTTTERTTTTSPTTTQRTTTTSLTTTERTTTTSPTTTQRTTTTSPTTTERTATTSQTTTERTTTTSPKTTERTTTPLPKTTTTQKTTTTIKTTELVMTTVGPTPLPIPTTFALTSLPPTSTVAVVTTSATTIPLPISSSTSPTTTTVAVTTTPTTTLDNRIQKDVTRQRGDVHIPRQPDQNQVWEFDIELGNTAEDDFADDPDAGVLHCSFDYDVCDWMSDQDGDLHWNTAAGSYLTVPELKAGQRSIRGARLVVPILPPWNLGNLCFSFTHWLTGHHVGVLQLFVRKRGRGQRYSPALWSRTGGHGWRHTQISLQGGDVDRVLLRGERRKGSKGEVAIDDITLRRGTCPHGNTLRGH